jgi:cytochrome c biogenesis protein CcdA
VSELLRTVAATTETLGGILFGIGSLLFFYLFYKSRYIPRWIAALGGIASGIWTTMYFAGLIFPERHAHFQLACFPPMLLAEVVTGVYLALFTVRTNLTS